MADAWKDLVELKEPAEFISGLESLLKGYVDEEKDLDQLVNETPFRAGSGFVGVMMKQQFDEDKARARCESEFKLKEYVTQGPGRRQKRNPKVEAIILIYKHMFGRWLSQRHRQLRDKKDSDGIANMSQWMSQVAPEYFNKALPQEAVKRRRKKDVDSLVKTGESSITATVESSTASADNTSIATGSLASVGPTDDGTSATDATSAATGTTECSAGSKGKKRNLDDM